MIDGIELENIFLSENFDASASCENGFYKVVCRKLIGEREYSFEQRYYFDFIKGEDHLSFLEQAKISLEKEVNTYFCKVAALNQ